MLEQPTNDEGAAGSPEPYFQPAAERTPGHGGASIAHMDDYPSHEIAEGLFFRPVFADNMSLNFVTFPPNSGFPSHGHPEEQISIVWEGRMELTIGDVTRMVGPGDIIVFPSNVPHAGRTMESHCRMIDIFSPARTGIRDMIAGADPQRSAEVDRWWDPSA